MTRRSTLVLLAASGAVAVEAAPTPERKPPHRLQGILSHGDSGDVLGDYFGSRVGRPAPEGFIGARQDDPAIRWDDRPVRH